MVSTIIFRSHRKIVESGNPILIYNEEAVEKILHIVLEWNYNLQFDQDQRHVHENSKIRQLD